MNVGHECTAGAVTDPPSTAMTTPLTSFSGLATGLDTDAIVSSLVAVESLPIRRLEQQQADNSSIRFRLDTIRGRLDTLKTNLEGLDTRAEVLATGTTSSDESVLTVSATGGASLGTYDVTVANLATAERTYSNTFADIDGTGLFGTGTLTIQVGSGDAVDVTVDGTTSLNNLATAINDADAGVSAAVIFDGTNYRLQVAGEATGLENAITFTESAGLSLGLDDPVNEVVAADDARFTIDTLSMTRPTNQVVSAIPGVTLDLQDTGSSTVRVDRDPEALLTKVRDFVDAYNSVTNGINAEFVFTGAARTGDSLNGDSTLRGLQSQLGFDAVQPLSGIPAGDFSTLAQLGISTSQTGALELDESIFTSALDSNPGSPRAALHGRYGRGASRASSSASRAPWTSTRTSIRGSSRRVSTRSKRRTGTSMTASVASRTASISSQRPCVANS